MKYIECSLPNYIMWMSCNTLAFGIIGYWILQLFNCLGIIGEIFQLYCHSTESRECSKQQIVEKK